MTSPVVFVSHHQSDTTEAGQVAYRLRFHHNIEVYLDVIDVQMQGKGEELAEYLRKVMSGCTHLLAVVSSRTAASWWVPWEIGVACEQEHPLATYSSTRAAIPEYLRKWPYLSTMLELDAFAEVAKASARRVFLEKQAGHSERRARSLAAATFYRDLRMSLRQ